MVVIRKAEPCDAVPLVDIGVRAWTGHIFVFEPETPGMRARAQRAFEDFVAERSDTIIVAEMDGGIRGWGARENGDDVISDLWVAPPWQGRGVGSALLRTLLANIREAGHDRARLDTHARNLDAIRFYLHHRFRIVESRQELSTSLGRQIEKLSLECTLSSEGTNCF